MLSRFCAGTYQGNELIRHTSKVVSSSLSICKPLLSENKSDIGTRKLSPLTKKKKKEIRRKEQRRKIMMIIKIIIIIMEICIPR